MISEGIYLIEIVAESLLQCSVSSLTTPPPTGESGTPFPVTFDASTVSNVSLSTNKLTATNTGTTSTDQGAHVPFASAKSSGKYYFEITVVSQGGNGFSADYGAGIGTVGSTFSGMGSSATSGLMEFTNAGFVIGNGSHLGTISAPSNGDTLGFAVDLDHLKFWVKNVSVPGSLWLNNTGDPASNTGGISVPAGDYVPFSTFGGAFGTAGQVQTANFGATAFVGDVPTGFTAGWPV